MSEDTATLLGDFVSAIDNVPSEIAHLMEEIGHKDELVQDIQLSAIHLEESLRKNQHQRKLYSNDELDAIQTQKDKYSEAMQISKEKIVLAERARALIIRHINKLNAQLEFLPDHAELPSLPLIPTNANEAENLLKSIATWSFNSDDVQSLLMLNDSTKAQLGFPTTDNPKKSSSSSRHSTSGRDRSRASHHSNPDKSLSSSSHSTSASARSHAGISPKLNPDISLEKEDRKRSVHTTDSDSDVSKQKRKSLPIVTPPNISLPVAPATQTNPPPVEEIDGEDPTPYCFCHRPSYGEMIGCDSSDCKYEWFHLTCVGLKSTPEGRWYCADCQARLKKKKRH